MQFSFGLMSSAIVLPDPVSIGISIQSATVLNLASLDVTPTDANQIAGLLANAGAAPYAIRADGDIQVVNSDTNEVQTPFYASRSGYNTFENSDTNGYTFTPGNNTYLKSVGVKIQTESQVATVAIWNPDGSEFYAQTTIEIGDAGVTYDEDTQYYFKTISNPEDYILLRDVAYTIGVRITGTGTTNGKTGYNAPMVVNDPTFTLGNLFLYASGFAKPTLYRGNNTGASGVGVTIQILNVDNKVTTSIDNQTGDVIISGELKTKSCKENGTTLNIIGALDVTNSAGFTGKYTGVGVSITPNVVQGIAVADRVGGDALYLSDGNVQIYEETALSKPDNASYETSLTGFLNEGRVIQYSANGVHGIKFYMKSRKTILKLRSLGTSEPQRIKLLDLDFETSDSQYELLNIATGDSGWGSSTFTNGNGSTNIREITMTSTVELLPGHYYVLLTAVTTSNYYSPDLFLDSKHAMTNAEELGILQGDYDDTIASIPTIYSTSTIELKLGVDIVFSDELYTEKRFSIEKSNMKSNIYASFYKPLSVCLAKSADWRDNPLASNIRFSSSVFSGGPNSNDSYSILSLGDVAMTSDQNSYNVMNSTWFPNSVGATQLSANNIIWLEYEGGKNPIDIRSVGVWASGLSSNTGDINVYYSIKEDAIFADRVNSIGNLTRKYQFHERIRIDGNTATNENGWYYGDLQTPLTIGGGSHLSYNSILLGLRVPATFSVNDLDSQTVTVLSPQTNIAGLLGTVYSTYYTGGGSEFSLDYFSDTAYLFTGLTFKFVSPAFDNTVLSDDTMDLLIKDQKTRVRKLGIGADPSTYELEVNGEASKVGGGAWQVYSDARIKEEIQEIKAQDSVHRIERLRPVSFKYAKEVVGPSQKRYSSFIAQEFEKVYPDDVTTTDKKYGDVENVKTIDTSRVTMDLVNAVQYLLKKIQ